MEKSDFEPSAKSTGGSSSSRTRGAKTVLKKSSGSSRRGKQRHENVVRMKGIPKLTTKMRRQLKALDELPDERIDLSDIPESKFEGPGYVGLMYRPGKTSVTIRLDSDMVEWFKAQGKGWQTKMNWALRLYFTSHLKTGAVVGRP